MPAYTHIDTPGTASSRARLRLARARLRHDQQRLGFNNATSVTCRQCGKADETVKHVLEECDAPAVVAIRHNIYGKVVQLCEEYGEDINKVWNALNPTTNKKTSAEQSTHTHRHTYGISKPPRPDASCRALTSSWIVIMATPPH